MRSLILSSCCAIRTPLSCLQDAGRKPGGSACFLARKKPATPRTRTSPAWVQVDKWSRLLRLPIRPRGYRPAQAAIAAAPAAPGGGGSYDESPSWRHTGQRVYRL
jgi:hypothetical protein